jgi:hypothetical protein
MNLSDDKVWELARILSGYDDPSWCALKIGTRKTYRKAAEGLVYNWEKVKDFMKVEEVIKELDRRP